MLIRIPKGWEIPEREATDEGAFLARRRLIKGLAAGPIIAAVPGLLAGCDDSADLSADAKAHDPSASLYPVSRNDRYALDRPLTSEGLATSYNNYYEFGSSKSIVSSARHLPLRPWMVRIDGMVEKPIDIGIDDLLAQMPLEERLYRHRCVEAWSMAVSWSGFPLAKLVEMARPSAGAKYLRMVGFEKPAVASGQRASWYPWPYIEGLTMAEATNELAFLVTGAYGKSLPKQNGAPLRLAVPWKYGFKHIKGIVRFEFTDKRPVSFWERVQGSEYGFWANVNPNVPHRRWSQATERVLGTGKRVPTHIYNGYGEYVAHIYEGIKGERLFT